MKKGDISRFKRKIAGKTNYRKRLKLVLSHMPRLVVRKFNRNLSAQIINYAPDGDITLTAASSKQLAKLGWSHSRKNIPAAYLTGLLLGKKAAEKGVKKAVLDLGFHPSVKGSRIYAVLKGLLDAGIDIPSSDTVVPHEERISGKHILGYFAKKPKGHFTKGNAAKLGEDFEAIKKKIIG